MRWSILILAVLLLDVGSLYASERDTTSVEPQSESQLSDNEPYVWWKDSWFPYYNWTGHRMRPHFGVSPVYPESFLRGMSAIRYNRVEGLTLGVGVPRLSRRRIGTVYWFGQLSYAFSLNEVRYQLGLELPVTRKEGARNRLLVGGSIYSNTATNDIWKVSDPENSLAAVLFNEDHLDYFDTFGWSGWVTGELGGLTQLTASFRSDRYRSLDQNTDWSVFGGSGFRSNPTIDEGHMNSIVLRLEAGRVGGLYSVPQGWSIQGEAEFGQGLGGDFDFNRYELDGRLYWSPEYWYGVAVRVRGGFSTDNAPIQKTFTVGGLGSVRAWSQNRIRGTRMTTATFEASVDDIDLLVKDLQLLAFGDVGWAGYSDASYFSSEATIAAVGLGVGFDQRRLRVELAVPVGTDSDSSPWLWLRLYPTF